VQGSAAGLDSKIIPAGFEAPLKFLTGFTHHLDKNISVPPSVIEIDEDDLLPRSQSQSSLDEGDSERRFHQGCPDV